MSDVSGFLTSEQKPDRPSVSRRFGTVLAVNAGPPQTVDVELAVSGITIPGVPILASYAPIAGDAVVVDFTDDTPLAMGSVKATATRSPVLGDRNDTQRLKAETRVVTLNAAGQQVVGFATAFPTACDTIVVNNGDIGVSPGGVFGLVGWTAADFTFQVTPNPGAINVRVNYIALGH